MPGRNPYYHGPVIAIELMRATNIPWQQRSLRNGFLVSNAQKREQYPAAKAEFGLLTLHTPLEADTAFGHTGERELRNMHSQSSTKKSGAVETPNSKYVSLTSSAADTSWGEGANPTIVFKFQIWRSDLWKGKHDLSRDDELHLWLISNILTRPPVERDKILSELTPPDWDRGAEFEWLALGGTKVFNVRESRDGKNWADSTPFAGGVDFWWESLEEPKKPA